MLLPESKGLASARLDTSPSLLTWWLRMRTRVLVLGLVLVAMLVLSSMLPTPYLALAEAPFLGLVLLAGAIVALNPCIRIQRFRNSVRIIASWPARAGDARRASDGRLTSDFTVEECQRIFDAAAAGATERAEKLTAKAYEFAKRAIDAPAEVKE